MSRVSAERLDVIAEETRERFKALVTTMEAPVSQQETIQRVATWAGSFESWRDTLTDAECIYVETLRALLMVEFARWLDEA